MQLVDSLDGARGVVLVAVPAEVVAARAGHVRAARDLLDGDVALGALVGHDQVEGSHQALQGVGAAGCQGRLALGAVVHIFAGAPLALVAHVHVVATLGGALLYLLVKCRILPEECLLDLYLIALPQRI